MISFTALPLYPHSRSGHFKEMTNLFGLCWESNPDPRIISFVSYSL